MDNLRIGEILLRRGELSQSELLSALEMQSASDRRLGEILVARKMVDEDPLYTALAEQLGFQFESLDSVETRPELTRFMSHRFASNHLVLPHRLDPAAGELAVATSNPQDIQLIDTLKRLCEQQGLRLRVVVASPTAIRRGINVRYQLAQDEPPATRSVGGDLTTGQRADLARQSDLPAMRSIVNQMLHRAAVEGASDIHIENLESGIRVRFRIDGILLVRETPVNRRNIDAIISVLKIDSGLDITERRRPQDGVLTKRIGEDWNLDFRINVHCTRFGQDAVIRILDTSRKLPGLNEIGFPSWILELYLRLIQNPQGLLIMTGPTGSGKSTTLYSTLASLNTPEKKIVTAEDPIEYHLDGICQYQVNPQIGNTFAEFGRRFLRKDPDIILIGEIRDEATADSCVRAALTGHLVFTTLHTNHSLAVLTRLLVLGVEPSVLSEALLGVVCQRLVRRTCQNCSVAYSPQPVLLSEFFGHHQPCFDFVRGTGCQACLGTGFKGRTGIFELWEINPTTREALSHKAREPDLRRLASGSGFKPLSLDGLEKVRAGLTTLEEIRRTLSREQILEYRSLQTCQS